MLPRPVKRAIINSLGTKSADRQRIVRSYVSSDDSVLDVGCVEHSLDRVNWRNPEPGEWMHADLRRISNDVFGIDIVDEAIERLQNEGFNVAVGNAEKFELDRDFDVIVAGELIEHLSNPGQFLDRCREHLSEDGAVIITTPNPRRLQMLHWFARGHENRANPEHTTWFDHYVMETLVARHGFEVDEWHWYKPSIGPIVRMLYRRDICTPLIAGGYVFKLKTT